MLCHNSTLRPAPAQRREVPQEGAHVSHHKTLCKCQALASLLKRHTKQAQYASQASCYEVALVLLEGPILLCPWMLSGSSLLLERQTYGLAS